MVGVPNRGHIGANGGFGARVIRGGAVGELVACEFG